MAARIAPLRGITEQSMRQATWRAERHVAQLLGKVRNCARISVARHMIAAYRRSDRLRDRLGDGGAAGI